MSIHPVLWCLRVPCHVAPELVESVVARLHRLGEFAGAWRTQCRPTCVRAPSRRCLNHADAQLFELGCEAFRLHHVFAQMTPPTTGRGIQTRSILSCPECGHTTELEMPQDACLFLHECEACQTLLRPLPSDCCVFCSYGSVKCPPIQQQSSCCGSPD